MTLLKILWLGCVKTESETSSWLNQRLSHSSSSWKIQRGGRGRVVSFPTLFPHGRIRDITTTASKNFWLDLVMLELKLRLHHGQIRGRRGWIKDCLTHLLLGWIGAITTTDFKTFWLSLVMVKLEMMLQPSRKVSDLTLSWPNWNFDFIW